MDAETERKIRAGADCDDDRERHGARRHNPCQICGQGPCTKNVDSAADLKVGDRVRVESIDGPIMRVDGISRGRILDEDAITCLWFNAHNVFFRERIQRRLLVKVTK